MGWPRLTSAITSMRDGSCCVVTHTRRSLPPSAVIDAARGRRSRRFGIRCCGSHSSIAPATATTNWRAAAPAAPGSPRAGNWYGVMLASPAVSTAAVRAPIASAYGPTVVRIRIDASIRICATHCGPGWPGSTRCTVLCDAPRTSTSSRDGGPTHATSVSSGAPSSAISVTGVARASSTTTIRRGSTMAASVPSGAATTRAPSAARYGDVSLASCPTIEGAYRA